MEDFGKRLKEERERLGLSQLKFAEACGIGRTAQFNYERGERRPSMFYMEAADKLGVDTHYVFTGTKKGKDWAYARAYSTFLYTIEWRLGLREKEIEKLCKQRVELDEKVNWFGEEGKSSESVYFGDWIEAVDAWLATAKHPDACLDMDLFTQVIAAIEDYAARTSKTLSPDRKAKSSVMLYRSFKAAGKMDPKMIEEAVALAAD